MLTVLAQVDQSCSLMHVCLHLQGHMDELWGLASHPNQNQFATCGYDRLLYMWDTMTHSAIWMLDLPVSCVALIELLMNHNCVLLDSSTRILYVLYRTLTLSLFCIKSEIRNIVIVFAVLWKICCDAVKK